MKNSLFISAANPIASNTPSQRGLSILSTDQTSQEIRHSIAGLSLDPYQGVIGDLGHLAATAWSDLSDIIVNLAESENHLPFLVVDNDLRDFEIQIVDQYISPVFIANAPVLTDEYPHIGLQKHFIEPLFDIDDTKHVRLGTLKHDIQGAEVRLRDADYVSIDLNVLRRSDNLGCGESITAGLTIEELCMIAKYTGASTHLKTIVIKGYDADEDIYGMMAQNVALIYWYVLDGFMLRQAEVNTQDMIKQYTVCTADLEHELVFSQHLKTDRWWVAVHSEEADEEVPFACTKTDYEAACNNEISERILTLLTKV